MPSRYSSSLSLLSLSILASVVSAETTTTATVLVPDWCVTQNAPTVTASVVQNDRTVYSYKCSYSELISSAHSKASAVASSLEAKASDIRQDIENIPGRVDEHINHDLIPDVNINIKRDDCFGFGAWDACIPWEVTQGPSYWAVHLNTNGVGGLDQECSFTTTMKDGSSQTAAVCTASGRLDPKIWGVGAGPHTITMEPSDVDHYFIRNTVSVTEGGEPLQTGSAGDVGGSGTTGSNGTGTGSAVESEETGLAAPNSIPGGLVAMLAGAGGILAAAIAL